MDELSNSLKKIFIRRKTKKNTLLIVSSSCGTTVERNGYATFEVHTEVLLNAARHANLDHMRGVSASVLCGQYGNYGTGSFNVILDLEKMKDLNEVVVEKSKTANELFDLHDETNDKSTTSSKRLKKKDDFFASERFSDLPLSEQTQRALKDIITITNRFTRDIYCKIQGI